jgi:hypothetical protein
VVRNSTVERESEENIGFGSANVYDVEELFEIANIDVKNRKSEADYECTDDILKDLRAGCVSNASKNLYQSANVLFLYYIYEIHRYLLHKTWIRMLTSLSFGITDKNKKTEKLKAC